MPGTHYRYNQTNYVLLGKVIERVAGRPFTRFMADRQFAPAGMTQAAFGDARTFGHRNLFHGAGTGGLDLVLHLHRFEHEKDLALLDGIARDVRGQA